MQFEIYENGKKIKQLSFEQFLLFYYSEFGHDCGNPDAIGSYLEVNQSSYIGKGYTVVKTLTLHVAGDYCSHSRKYLNKITNTLQFYVCPDCKKEV